MISAPPKSKTKAVITTEKNHSEKWEEMLFNMRNICLYLNVFESLRQSSRRCGIKRVHLQTLADFKEQSIRGTTDHRTVLRLY